MMNAMFFGNVSEAVNSIDRMFPGLEAVVCDGEGNHLSGVVQKVEGGPRPWFDRYSDGETVFSFQLDVMKGQCPQDELVTGIQIGIAGEYCGSPDEHREFEALVLRTPEIWGIRRI